MGRLRLRHVLPGLLLVAACLATTAALFVAVNTSKPVPVHGPDMMLVRSAASLRR